MDEQQQLRYSRHLLLGGWDDDVQQRLLGAHAVVVGVGGLGAPAAMYLASAGVGRITLIDPDRVELSNLQRQVAHATDRIGQDKAGSARQALQALNPDVHVEALVQRADEAWLKAWLLQCQLAAPAASRVVLDCTDSLATRHDINRACWAARTPLVSASAVQWDAQITAFVPMQPGSPCYACLYPLPDMSPPEGDVAACASMDTPCGALGVFAPLVGAVGVMQAGEAIKCLSGADAWPGHASLVGRLLVLDGRTWQTRELRIRPRADCPVCGHHDT